MINIVLLCFFVSYIDLCRYFKVYDTEDRQGLLEAYHDQVGFQSKENL